MKTKRLSFRQGMALLWCAQLGPAAELLPGEAGGVGILSVLVLGMIAAAVGLVVGRLCREGEGLAGALAGSLGCWSLYLYIIWCVLLLALRLHLAAGRLLDTGERDGSGWFFLLVLAGLALWIGCGQIDALGRTGEIVLGVLTVTGGVVLLLALPQIKGKNLLSCLNFQSGWVREAMGNAGNVLGCGLFAAFLVDPEERDRRRWLRWTTAGSLVLAAAQSIVLGCFGPRLAASLEKPFFHLAKGVGVRGAFQRVESLVAALWTFGDLILLAGVLWAARRIVKRINPGTDDRKAAVGVLVLAAAAALIFGKEQRLVELAQSLVPVSSLVLGLGVPLGSLSVKIVRAGRK